jgi:hypothetical protein
MHEDSGKYLYNDIFIRLSQNLTELFYLFILGLFNDALINSDL